MIDRGDELDTPGKRFNWFIVECYGGVPAYVEQFDFNASQVYRTISNSSSPRLETCVEYSATGINVQWMASGEGPWWAPNDVGRELAKKKGIAVDDLVNRPPTDYRPFVHSVLALAEDYIVAKIVAEYQLTTSMPHLPAKKSTAKIKQ